MPQTSRALHCCSALDVCGMGDRDLRRAAYCVPSGTVTKPIFSMPAVRAFDITSAMTS